MYVADNGELHYTYLTVPFVALLVGIREVSDLSSVNLRIAYNIRQISSLSSYHESCRGNSIL